MSEQAPTTQTPETATPLPIDPNLQPSGYKDFDNLYLQTLTDTDLITRYNNRVDTETADLDVIDKTNGKVQKLSASNGARAANVHAISTITGRRSVTDPVGNASERELPRAEETRISKNVLGRFMGKIAAKYSLSGPNGSDIKTRAESAPTPDQLSPRQQRVEIRNAKRNMKQLKRQARSQRAEEVHGAGRGIGVTSRSATALHRSEKLQDLKSQYQKGEITSAQYVDLRNRTKLEKVMVPARAVTHAVRHERAGAAYSLLRADQLALGGLKRSSQQRAESGLSKTEQRLEETRAELALMEQELQRRGLMEAPAVAPSQADTEPTDTTTETTTQDPERTKPLTPTSWETVYDFVAGDYKDYEHSTAYSHITEDDISDFIIEQDELVEYWADIEGIDPRRISDDDWDRLHAVAKSKIQPSTLKYVKLLQSERIIGTEADPQDGFKVLMDNNEIREAKDDYIAKQLEQAESQAAEFAGKRQRGSRSSHNSQESRQGNDSRSVSRYEESAKPFDTERRLTDEEIDEIAANPEYADLFDAGELYALHGHIQNEAKPLYAAKLKELNTLRQARAQSARIELPEPELLRIVGPISDRWTKNYIGQDREVPQEVLQALSKVRVRTAKAAEQQAAQQNRSS